MADWTLRLGEGPLPDKMLIGGKAWSIARMADLGLPVPPAFVITTRACAACTGGTFPSGLEQEIAAGMAWLEARTGRTFGRGPRPLLVSVRSGAPVSMPGMMDTILNMGITAKTESALAAEAGDPAFARDTHRRFYDLFARIVLKSDIEAFDPALGPADWDAVLAAAGLSVPVDPVTRLHRAVQAVFDSWNSRRARRYRQHHAISDALGTAVTVQAMVFGNLSDASGTGVVFSRNPVTGESLPYGEYLPRAQGEDVVSGRYTPRPLGAMRASVPQAHDALLAAARVLEQADGDVQDIEFTVQEGQLFLLQSRAAKRGPAAAVRFAVDMVAEGRIDAETALSRVTPDQVRALLAPRLAQGQAEGARLLASGEAACPGIGIGRIVTDTDEAEARAAAGEDVILARVTTSPEDLHGMIAARAVITELGGTTSHAAVVSRALGVPCVTGCGAGSLGGMDGRIATVDGTTGRIYDGALRAQSPSEDTDRPLAALAGMAQARAPLRVLPAGADAGAEVVDLNAAPGGDDPASLPRLLAGARAATGGALATEAGIAAAIAAGVDTVLGSPVLPLLLAAARATLPGLVPADRDSIAVSASAED